MGESDRRNADHGILQILATVYRITCDGGGRASLNNGDRRGLPRVLFRRRHNCLMKQEYRTVVEEERGRRQRRVEFFFACRKQHWQVGTAQSPWAGARGSEIDKIGKRVYQILRASTEMGKNKAVWPYRSACRPVPRKGSFDILEHEREWKFN